VTRVARQQFVFASYPWGVAATAFEIAAVDEI
jgi:hypothetical protein